MEHDLVKIVVSGAESTGKTEISNYLSRVFQSPVIPEYARSYVEQLSRPYSYEDVEHIAQMQQQKLEEVVQVNPELIILDTYLVITKIWFKEVYGKVPDWLDQKLRDSKIDLFLLCYHDIEWIADPVRENPGLKRDYLFEQYRSEIVLLGVPFYIVKGTGNMRFENSKKAILNHFSHLKNRMQ